MRLPLLSPSHLTLAFLFSLGPRLCPFPRFLFFFLFSLQSLGADTVFLDCLGSLELDFRLVIIKRKTVS